MCLYAIGFVTAWYCNTWILHVDLFVNFFSAGKLEKIVCEGILKNRAFTLIEILLVVVLLTIIALVVIPLYWDSQTSVRIARAQADIAILNRQLELYNANEENFPNATLTYTYAARLMNRAGYIKFISQPPEGFRYSFDGNTGSFVYTEVED